MHSSVGRRYCCGRLLHCLDIMRVIVCDVRAHGVAGSRSSAEVVPSPGATELCVPERLRARVDSPCSSSQGGSLPLPGCISERTAGRGSSHTGRGPPTQGEDPQTR
ncbi:hypothetical protein NDU88_007574, partial [Pleurodeles waltl]